MSVITDRPAPAEEARPSELRRPASRRSWVDAGVVVAFALVGVHAVLAWALWPSGDPSLAARAARLAGVVAIAGVVAFVWWRPGWDRTRAAVCLAVGVVAVIPGVAVSLLSFEGLRFLAVVGVASLAASLFLIGVGWVRLFGRRPWWRPVLALAASIVVLWFGVVPIAMGVYATNPGRAEAGPRTPTDVGLAFEDVRIATAEDLRLAAWYVPSTNGATIVLLHGSGSTRDDMLDHADVLGRHGFGLLIVDARGHGASTGEAMDLGWGGEDDIVAAIDYLVGRPDVDADRIALVGASMGGEQAITAAAKDPRVAAVVSDGASLRTFGDASAHPEIVGGWLGLPGAWLTMTTADLLSDPVPPIPLTDAVAKIGDTPVLLIAGAEHQEAVANPLYADEGGPNVQLWELPDAAHISGVRTHRAEYEERLIGFLERALDIEAGRG